MQSLVTLSPTTHRTHCHDWPDGSGRVARWRSLQEHPGIWTSAYNPISLGASQAWIALTTSANLRPSNISSQLVHRIFQKYEPQSPGVCALLLLIVPAMVPGVFVGGASSALGALFRTYTIFHTTLISSVVLYRLSPFHPLARYPGPALAKVSKLWFVSTHEV